VCACECRKHDVAPLHHYRRRTTPMRLNLDAPSHSGWFRSRGPKQAPRGEVLCEVKALLREVDVANARNFSSTMLSIDQVTSACSDSECLHQHPASRMTQAGRDTAVGCSGQAECLFLWRLATSRGWRPAPNLRRRRCSTGHDQGFVSDARSLRVRRA
jgi:hypothetical protein